MTSLVITLLLGYLAICLVVSLREPHMIYLPSRDLVGSPRDIGLHYDDLTLTTADGVRVHAWHIPGPSAPTVLFLHGNAGNISYRLEKIALLHQLGVGVLILDYRGYGRSEGRPNEKGTYLDAQAAYDYLAAHNLPVVLYGESLGCGVAVELATRVTVAGVILEAPFTSIADVGQRLFPYLPVRWLVRNRYENLRKIPQITAPVLILHSRDDEIFSFAHAEQLHAAARAPKKLVALRGSHNDAFLVSASEYREALREFLANLAARR
ncbi:MAG: alpha/beta hydrolase [Verrucomicrobiae bacterium]|nr:alpha/beta hydrolase [Verrucomicrobiae bacterium]